jgi:hypothetical protein
MGFQFNTSVSTTNHGLITTSDTERFRITSNGTFLTDNSSTFNVMSGTSTISTGITNSGTISTGISNGTSTINFVGGTIGIGTSSPSHRFHITDKKIFKFLRGYGV